LLAATSNLSPDSANLLKRTGTRDSNSNADEVVAPALDSLDALNSSEDEGVAPRGGSGVTYFADETPAIKPTRELPEGITKEQLGFVENLDTIYEVIHDADLLGGVIRNIMIELKSQPEYTKLMAPDDFRTMVRGMRESMGLARVKKQESKAKKSGGTRKSKALGRRRYGWPRRHTRRHRPMSAPLVINYEILLGVFIAGLIIGWFLSIGVAWRIARRDDRGLWKEILKQDRREHD
jgi:hypothetical protein